MNGSLVDKRNLFSTNLNRKRENFWNVYGYVYVFQLYPLKWVLLGDRNLSVPTFYGKYYGKHEVENTFLNGIWNLVAIKITLKGYCDLFLRTAWCDWKNYGMWALFPGKGTNDFCGNGVVRIRFNFTVKVKRTSYAKILSPSVRLKILVKAYCKAIRK